MKRINLALMFFCIILVSFACKSLVIVKNPIFEFNQMYNDFAASTWQQGVNITIGVGESIQLGLKNINKNIIVEPNWLSTDNIIGEIDKDGIFKAKQQGNVTITAKLGESLLKTYYITVVPNNLSSPLPISLSPTPTPTPGGGGNSPSSTPVPGVTSSPTPTPTPSSLNISIISPVENSTFTSGDSVTIKARINKTLTTDANVKFYYRNSRTGSSTLIGEHNIIAGQTDCSISWDTWGLSREYYLEARTGEISSALVKVTISGNDPPPSGEITAADVAGGGHSTVLSINPPNESTIWTVKYNDANIGTLMTNTGAVTVWTAPSDAEANANFGINAPYKVKIEATCNAQKEINVNYGNENVAQINGNY